MAARKTSAYRPMSEAAPPPKPLRRTAARMAVSAAVMTASFVVALLLAEVIVRLVAPQQLILIRPDLWQPADGVGWLHRPNVAATINTGEGSVRMYTDSEGFRVGNSGRREAPVEVLLIGDSFMEALAVEHERTVAHLLENELTRQLATPVAVRNAGVGGWNANQYLLRTRELVREERFALVVVAVYVGNDAIARRMDHIPPRTPVERNRFRLPRGLTWDELVGTLLAPVNDALEARSHLFIMLKNQFSTTRMRLGLTAEYFPQEYRRPEAQSPRWEVTAEVLGDLAVAANERGALTLFVLIPDAFQVYERVFHDYVRGFGIDSTTVDIDQPSRLLGKALAALGLCVVDALPALRAAPPDGPRLFGTVDKHLSPAGHALLTDLIAPQAAELLLHRMSRRQHGAARLCRSTNRAVASQR